MIARAISQYGGPAESTPQIVYYQKGVGSSLDALERIPILSTLTKPKDGQDTSMFDGAFGVGLYDNVREGYGFLAHNYDLASKDQIYLFGWSRGAYTARSIAGLVSAFGLLDRKGMDRIGEVYTAYRDGCFAADVSDQEKKDRAETLRKECQPRKPRIRCIGVWDTVGSLGIPDIQVLGFHVPFKNIFSDFNEKFQFHDTTLHPNVDFGFHA